jgi:hypothetical protein
MHRHAMPSSDMRAIQHIPYRCLDESGENRGFKARVDGHSRLSLHPLCPRGVVLLLYPDAATVFQISRQIVPDGHQI